MALSEAINRAIRDALWKSDFRLADFEARVEGRTVRFLASTLLERRLADDAAVDQAEFLSSPSSVSDASLVELISSGEGAVPASALLEQQLREQAAAVALAAPAPAGGGLGEVFIPQRVVSAKTQSAGGSPLVSEVITERVFLGRVSGIYVKLDTGTSISGGIRVSAFKGSGSPPLLFDDTQEDDLLPPGSMAGATGPFGGVGHLGIGTGASTPGVQFSFNLLYEVVPPVRFVIRVTGSTDRAAAIFEIGELASGLTGIQQVTTTINESIGSRAAAVKSNPDPFPPTMMVLGGLVESNPRVVTSLAEFIKAFTAGWIPKGLVTTRSISRL